MTIQDCKDYLCKLLAYGILFSQLNLTGMNIIALNVIALLVYVYRYVVGLWIVSGYVI